MYKELVCVYGPTKSLTHEVLQLLLQSREEVLCFHRGFWGSNSVVRPMQEVPLSFHASPTSFSETRFTIEPIFSSSLWLDWLASEIQESDFLCPLALGLEMQSTRPEFLSECMGSWGKHWTD